MSHHFASLKSISGNAQLREGEASRAWPENMARLSDKAMHPKSTASHVQTSHRTRKMKASVPGRKGRDAITLNDHFREAIDNYRNEFASVAGRQLDQTEHILENQLAEIAQEFGGKLQVVADHEDSIFKPITEERLEITTLSPEKNGKARKQQASLADRMQNFERVLSYEAAQLENLWREWQQTHLELVCLAVEVLGLDEVGLRLLQDDDSLTAKIHAATTAHGEQEAARTEVKGKISELEAQIHAMADKTIKTLHEQEKEWKVHEKKKIEKIRQIMMEAE